MGGDDEGPKKKVEEMGRTKEVRCQPPGAGVAFAARRRRQAFARPLVGPPRTLCVECPRLVDFSLLNPAQSSKLKAPPLERRFRKLDRGETTATGIFPAISGGHPILFLF